MMCTLAYIHQRFSLQEIFDRRDIDQSGSISFEEFVIAMHNRKQQAKQCVFNLLTTNNLYGLLTMIGYSVNFDTVLILVQ